MQRPVAKPPPADPGHMKHHVEPTLQEPEGLLNQPLDLCRIDHIGRQVVDEAANGFERPKRLASAVRITTGNDDPRSLLQKSTRRGQADPARSADDQRRSTGEPPWPDHDPTSARVTRSVTNLENRLDLDRHPRG
jgi:hypothetical protein